ncbi:MAG: hypothetical protein B0A82_11870 [Alkalinema sp. CACIAM 70d]|nr:MAG: hypothetical protein B0A82_11870 [Alkalinema sp. CACIAM 70d]
MTSHLVCTIITKNYLAYARALAISLAEHNPGLELYVLLADRNDGEIDPEQEPFHLIPLESLANQAAVQRMCFYYTPFELCCALRGLLHRYILDHTTAERWIFLDSDIYVCGSLEPVFEQLRSAAILLTPHNQTPPEIERANICEVHHLLQSGLYNAGFLGLRRCEITSRFLNWWHTRLSDFCFNDLEYQDSRGLFVDQLWLNLVPLYFPKVEFLQDLGCNLGHWNLWERPLSQTGPGLILAGGSILRFVHFSGWSFENPTKVSRYDDFYESTDQPVWAELGVNYQALLREQGYAELKHLSYGFARFVTGEPITLAMRRAYYDDLQAGRAIAQPFSQAQFFLSRTYEPGNNVRLLWREVAQLQQQVRELKTVEVQCQELQTQSQELQTQYQELADWAMALEAQCHRSEQALERSQQKYDQLMDSYSMRITAPLRSWKRQVRKLREGLPRLSKRLLKLGFIRIVLLLKLIPGMKRLLKDILRRFPKLESKLRSRLFSASLPLAHSSSMIPVDPVIPPELLHLTATARSVYAELKSAIEKHQKDE